MSSLASIVGHGSWLAGKACNGAGGDIVPACPVARLDPASERWVVAGVERRPRRRLRQREGLANQRPIAR